MTEVMQQQGNITIDDVRAALSDTDPNSTNASRLRAIIGRGSLATIQRHLDTIRAEKAPQPLEAVGEAPAVPKDVMQSLWSAAWQAAQAQSSGALAAALARLDVTEQALVTARADADSAHAAADTAVSLLADEKEQTKKAVETLVQENEALSKALEEARSKAEAEARAAHDALTTAKAEADLARERAAAALELVEAKHQAAQEAMRSEMDRLVNQLADLRAALARPVQAE